MSDVRAMLACLANEEIARVYANIVLHRAPGDELSLPRRQKAVDALIRSGLVTSTGDELVADSASIRAILRDQASPRTASTDDLSRWIDAEGRIVQYPRRATDRARLLQTVGERTVGVDERISEAEINDRLSSVADDVPALRRYLVVHGVLAREPDGSAYWRS